MRSNSVRELKNDNKGAVAKMKTNIFKFKLPHNSIIAEDSISVVIKPSNKQQAKVEKISGLLAGIKFKSVDLQHKAKDWWKNVSD